VVKRFTALELGALPGDCGRGRAGVAHSAASLGEMGPDQGRRFGVSPNLLAEAAMVMKSREAADRTGAVGGGLVGSHHKADGEGAGGSLPGSRSAQSRWGRFRGVGSMGGLMSTHISSCTDLVPIPYFTARSGGLVKTSRSTLTRGHYS
jgi:hypothetical protein